MRRLSNHIYSTHLPATHVSSKRRPLFSRFSSGPASSFSSRLRSSSPARVPSSQRRLRFLALLFIAAFIGVLTRLYYWQVMMSAHLRAQLATQYNSVISTQPHRGKIYTSDGFPLVTNKKVYRLIAQPHLLKQSPEEMSASLAQLLAPLQFTHTPDATLTAVRAQEAAYQETFLKRMTKENAKWVVLAQDLSPEQKQAMADLKLQGLVLEPYEMRDYPEASMAAHILGFVGKTTEGEDRGSYGVEGALDQELRGREQSTANFFLDGLGFRQFFTADSSQDGTEGKEVVLTIRRDVQHLLEQKLQEGMEKTGAKSGEIIVMEVPTGKILGLATLPTYIPGKYREFDQELFKNPSVTAGFEPGSIFKVLTVAAGIDRGVLNGDTICAKCAGPRSFGGHTIKTWNEQYHPNITIKDGLAKSDNVAMVFALDLIGEKNFLEYIKSFGIGEKIGFEIQEDTGTMTKKTWQPLDVATTTFGQGVSSTSMQMVRAVGAIANKGSMMQPQIIEKFIDPQTGAETLKQPVVIRQVISAAAAEQTINVMVYATQTAEHKWQTSNAHTVAGKTGTAQIFVKSADNNGANNKGVYNKGTYDPDKTIASYIGFAPAHNAKFIMLVKFVEPNSSTWSDQTAAPLWYEVAQELYLLLNIPPDR